MLAEVVLTAEAPKTLEGGNKWGSWGLTGAADGPEHSPGQGHALGSL